MKAWLDPWHDPMDAGFQIIQSLLAVGTGGITGRGFMRGLQKIGFLPEPQTDFIYAVIAEEFGLIGATLVLLTFLVIAWRGYRIATHMPDRFGAFLALGLTAVIVAQALINMSVVLGILPNKGLPLPFVSAGGSSMLISMLSMGILLNVSQHTTNAPLGGSERGCVMREERHAARRDRRRGDRGPSLPRRRGGARDRAAAADGGRDLCGHGARDRGTGRAARGLRARHDSQPGAEGQVPAALVRGLAMLPLSAWDAWRVVARRRPHVVVGVGGYSSGPIVVMAWLRGVPTLLHEQNAQPGLTNRLLARIADAVAVTFDRRRHGSAARPSSAGTRFAPGSCRQRRRQDRARKVLIFGGSQGAHAINVAMVEAASELARAVPPPLDTHQTGRATWMSCGRAIGGPGWQPGWSPSSRTWTRR